MSIALTNDKWDIYVDPSGNLAMTDTKTGILQNVATAIQMWCADGAYEGDNIYDIEQGLPYKRQVLGASSTYGMSLLMNEVAENVPGVSKARCRLNNPVIGRQVKGIMQVKLQSGEIGYVKF